MILLLLTFLRGSFCIVTQFPPFQTTISSSSEVNGTTVYTHEIYLNKLSINELFSKVPPDNSTKDLLKSQAPFDAMPKYLTSVKVDQEANWENSCFKQTKATIEITEKKGFQLHLETSEPKNWYCQDWYVLMTSEGMSFNIVGKKGNHTIKQRKWDSTEEYSELLKNGLRIFTFDGKALPTIKNIMKLNSFFKKIMKSKEKDLISFTEEQLGYHLIPKDPKPLMDIEPYLKSGDVLALHKLDGLSQLHWYFTGSHVSHVGIIVREDAEEPGDEKGRVMIYETTSNDFFPGPPTPWGNGFRRTEFKQWIDSYSAANYSIAWLPLANDVSQRFVSGKEKAVEWFEKNLQALTNVSLPYAHIDDLENNLPQDFSPNVVVLSLMFLEQKYPNVINRLFVKGMSMRLYHHFGAGPCTTVGDCLEECQRVGVDIFTLMNLEEREEWKYDTGTSVHPAALVMAMLREAGAFSDAQSVLSPHTKDEIRFETKRKEHQKKDPLFERWFNGQKRLRRKTYEGININPLEATINNLLMLKIYDPTRLPTICEDSSTSTIPQFCQISGPYRIDIPHFNSILPHENMFNRCQSKGPNWTLYPDDC